MAARKLLDRRRGSLPDIRTDGESVKFSLDIVGIETAARLVIRCDPDGSVRVSIENPPSR
jgi:hypothetical protein